MADGSSSILCWLYEYRQPVATVVSALVAGILAPFIGLKVYFRQKEHELVRTRFLDNGLDVIGKNAEYALGVFRHNWARGLTTLKHFRDSGADMPEALYASGYVELEPTSYNTSHSFVLGELFSDNIFHEVQQLLYSFVMNSNALIVYDLCMTLRLNIKGASELNITATRKEIVEQYFAELEKLNAQSNKFYSFLAVIHDLSSELSKKKFSFRTIEKFSATPIVREKTSILKSLFEQELIAHHESAN